MILSGFLVVFFLSCSKADTEVNSEEEVPFVIASPDSFKDQKVSNLLPDIDESEQPLSYQQAPDSGRSDIQIGKEQAFGGYVYPKPSVSFNLPAFKTLDPEVPLDGAASFKSEEAVEKVERSRRSPQRQTFYPPPPYRPIPGTPGGWTYSGIRPLPIYFGRPSNLLPEHLQGSARF